MHRISNFLSLSSSFSFSLFPLFPLFPLSHYHRTFRLSLYEYEYESFQHRSGYGYKRWLTTKIDKNPTLSRIYVKKTLQSCRYKTPTPKTIQHMQPIPRTLPRAQPIKNSTSSFTSTSLTTPTCTSMSSAEIQTKPRWQQQLLAVSFPGAT